jgi:GAF domain-containing protein
LDTLDDERFRDDPMVTGQPRPRFFAAIPIDDQEEGRLGTMCIFDSNPRRRIDDIDPDQVRLLTETVQREFPRILAASRADAAERRHGRIE